MTDLRVPHHRDAAGVRRGEGFSFRFDDREIQAYHGETVGAALTAAGITAFRVTRRQGRPRGLFCGIGICFDCLVEIDGRANQRACLAPARPGAVVKTQQGTGGV